MAMFIEVKEKLGDWAESVEEVPRSSAWDIGMRKRTLYKKGGRTVSVTMFVIGSIVYSYSDEEPTERGDTFITSEIPGWEDRVLDWIVKKEIYEKED